jgi:hypothetical protein
VTSWITKGGWRRKKGNRVQAKERHIQIEKERERGGGGGGREREYNEAFRFRVFRVSREEREGSQFAECLLVRGRKQDEQELDLREIERESERERDLDDFEKAVRSVHAQ